MILKDGYVVAKWGDTKRVDMTFSVTKSYLSTVAGLSRIGDFFLKAVSQTTFGTTPSTVSTTNKLLGKTLNQSSGLVGEFMGQL